MIRFRTEFTIPSIDTKINYASSVLLTGSCFSEHIGNHLSELKFRVLQHPFGIIYNPVSLATELKSLIGKRQINESELFYSAGVYRHFDFHGRFAHSDKQLALQSMNKAVEEGHSFLSSATHLIVTFGSSIAYRLKATGDIVANNHKLPAENFEKIQLTVSEIVDEWMGVIQKLKQLNKTIQIIFTISPVRHLRDGVVENNISKSVLVLAVKELTGNGNNCVYFPAYELMFDDLRDYRFYQDDLVHPNQMAVDYIFEKFTGACIDPGVSELVHEIRSIVMAKEHKPFFPGTDEHQNFKKQMLNKIKALQNKYPAIDFGEEIGYFNT